MKYMNHVGFIPGIQVGFNVRTVINLILHFNHLKEKKKRPTITKDAGKNVVKVNINLS